MTQQSTLKYKLKRNKYIYVYQKTYTRITMMALLLRVKKKKNVSIDKRMNQLWYIHTVKYYIAIRKNELHATAWMKLGHISG